MKVALSGMILGASMLGANADSLADGGEIVYTHGHKLTRSGKTLTADAGVVTCTAAPDRGDAYNAYPAQPPAAEVTLNTGDHETNANLAFFCEITGLPAGSEIQEDNGVERSGQGVLVIVQGDKDCGDGTLASSLSGSWNGERQYKPAITATKTYDCIKKQAETAEQVDTALAVVKTAAAGNEGVVGTQSLSWSFNMVRQDPLVFRSTETVTYDLGADHPHSAYYTSGLTCGEGDPCRGKITLSSGAASVDVSSDLTGASWGSDTAVQYFRLVNDAGDPAACSDKVYADTTTRSEAELCDMRTDIQYGQSGLMTTFKCPYDNSTQVGTRARVDECIDAGENIDVDNSCSARLTEGTNPYNDIDTVALSSEASGFNLKLQFPDVPKTRVFNFFPATFTQDGTAQYRPGAEKAVFEFSVDGDLAIAPEPTLKIVGGGSDGVLVPVSISDGKITAVLPVDATIVEFQTKGKEDCSAPDTLGNFKQVALSKSEIPDAAAAPGYFQKVDVCDRLFKFHTDDPDDNSQYFVNSVFAGGNDVTVKFADCADGVSEKACLEDPNARSPISYDKDHRRAIIEGACEGIAADQVGAFVQMDDGSGNDLMSARVICSGPCTDHDLADITLDWDVTFTVSLENALNELSVTEAHEYNGTAVDAAGKETFLSSSDQCAADGSRIGDAPASELNCDKTDFSAVGSAQEMVTKLSTCGGYLNQFVTVTDSKGDEYKFCNSKHLSVDIETMTGSSTDSIGVIASSAAAAATTVRAEMGFVGYKQCGESDGYYRLEAHAEIGSLVPLGWEASSHDPATTDIQWNSTLWGDRLIFQTECQNICSPESPLDEPYSLAGTLDESGCASEHCASLDIAMTIQITGSPCAESGSLERGDVALVLYSCLDGAAEAKADGSLCATLTPSDFGDSSLKVLDQELVKTDPYGSEVAVASPFWTNGETSPMSGDFTWDSQAFGNQLALDVSDAFHTYTLTVYWEQTLSSGGRRLLRSTHVYGAGEKSAKSSIFILPASAQIEDAAESLDAHETTEPTEPATEPATTEEEGLSGGAIAGIIAGGVVVAGGIAYAAVAAQGGRQQMGGAPQYSAVRRSERFSTMNF